MTHFIIADRDDDLLRFASLDDALTHCRDEEFIPSEVIRQDGRDYRDWSDDFAEDLREFAPRLFDFDEAHDMAAD